MAGFSRQLLGFQIELRHRLALHVAEFCHFLLDCQTIFHHRLELFVAKFVQRQLGVYCLVGAGTVGSLANFDVANFREGVLIIAGAHPGTLAS